MKIEAYGALSQIYNASKPANSKTTSTKANFKDSLNISNFGKDLQAAKDAVKATADVRADKVAYYKDLISKGEYDVSGEDFAEKMLERFSQTLA